MKDQEEEISRMLSGLKSVEAPDNFEGAVRTRIAEGRRDSTAGPTVWLAAKFALPLVLLLLLGGFFIVSNDEVVNVAMVPEVGNSTHEVADLTLPGTDLPELPRNDDTSSSSPQAPLNRNSPLPSPPQGGSQDHARSPDNSKVFRDGLDPQNARITNGQMPSGSISPGSILLNIGMSVECSSSGCSATAVREGSIAEITGIRAGDNIVAIDGRAINASTKFEGRVSVSDLTLVRDGKRIVVRIGRP